MAVEVYHPEKRERIELAKHQFAFARACAELHGFTLRCCHDAHYQLTDGTWLMNIYPGNRRLYHDRTHPKPPFLRVPAEWTLMDVVKAAINQKGEHDATD